MENEEKTPRAILDVTPQMLDFGVLNIRKPQPGQGEALVSIRNDGTRVMTGIIALQVAWVESDIHEFRLNPGESLDVTFRVTKHMPAVWTTNRYGSDFIALISGNGGAVSIGGYYFLTDEDSKRSQRTHTISGRFLLNILLSVFSVLLLIAGTDMFLKRETGVRQTETVFMIHTEAAETMEAALTAQVPTPTNSIADPADMIAFNATAAAIGASMISNINGGAEPTMTPWPADKYPSPQQFLFSYYMLLNDHNYEEAWWLLSESFQQTYYSGADTPMNNYIADVSQVRLYELASAYLQAEDVNPAEVRMNLIMYMNDGQMSDKILTVYIIDDPERNTLLINEIK